MEKLWRWKKDLRENLWRFFFTFENEILGKMCPMVARLFCMYKPKCRGRGGEKGKMRKEVEQESYDYGSLLPR